MTLESTVRRGQTKTGYFWAIARDDRPWGGTDPPAVVYTYATGRGSETAKIIRYGLRHWDGLTRFLDDGCIELDTNIVECSMRPQALTRKNALFAGHDDGAENWAILASIETAKLSDIDPQDRQYLRVGAQ